ncbi:hypothetical protein L0664_09855 [Octadecabacter sp. G9-8]|uniref:Uncharacterized protein n=1 Tax=Octadecabacter dasysiphoniae TaxID=2909341 RepID=A0ABS9CWC4_9RHOB|nr:hypothetical protein [Octadecabacter dasysiphoniae]MCF2871367.1 hypothetical protein [Octadecabacter dasysiphoniae]
MRQGNLDLMIEYAVACLATEDHRKIRKLVREMAQRWPNEKALAIAFSITSAAATFEDILDSTDAIATAQVGYQMAALVSADAFAVEAMGQAPAFGQDLLHFWRRVDPYFLTS